MEKIKVEKNVAGIEGFRVIILAIHRDSRRYFMEAYSQRGVEKTGIDHYF